jgi:hypothetical protein
MNQITFEKLKHNCVVDFCATNTRLSGAVSAGNNPSLVAIARMVELRATGKVKKVREFVKEIEDECVKAIEAVDIRNVKALAELCPESVPEWIKRGNYKVDLTDNGWVFFRN